MDRTEASLVAMRRILRATDVFGRELARTVGLTAVQLRALQVVAESGRCNATWIAQRMRVSQATVTALVDKLVLGGLVVRTRNAADRRQTDIVLTPQGGSRIAMAPDTLQEHFARRFEALEDWEQAQLVASLERVVKLLVADDPDASPVLGDGDNSGEGAVSQPNDFAAI